MAEIVSPENHQLLAQPFKLWVAPSSPTPAGLSPGQPAWYDHQGRLSMPVVGVGETAAAGQGMGGLPNPANDIRRQCVSPYELPAFGQPNCVMPTGWTMPIFDVKLAPLPLTGGIGTVGLMIGGGVLFIAVLGGAWWWRRRQQHAAAEPPNPGGEAM